MSDVTLSRVSKTYGGHTAVDDIDIHIEAGEFFTLLGPSGCGKTTTLRMIAGYETPDRGTIRFGERDITKVVPEKRDAGMVFQNYALFPHLTVAENIGYGLSTRRVPKADQTRRIADALGRVGLAGHELRRVSELSGGQQQRVALARAVVIEPSVLLLDEPLSNLDARLRDETRLQVKQIQEQSETTAVYVTHDQAEALAVSDRIAVLQHGRVDQIGTPHEIYTRPATAFVARFIGRANLLAGTIRETAGDHIDVTLRHGMALRTRANTASQATDGSVLVALRPEQLRLVADSAPGIPAVVVSVEYLGASVLVRAETQDGTVLTMSLVATGAPDAGVHAGERVRLGFDTESGWLVPA